MLYTPKHAEGYSRMYFAEDEATSHQNIDVHRCEFRPYDPAIGRVTCRMPREWYVDSFSLMKFVAVFL